MWQTGVPIPELILRAAIIYAAFIAALRVFGKREVGQFTIFDLALVLLAANALQPAMTGPDSSVLGGIVIIVTIFVLNLLVAQLREHVPVVRRLLEPGPTVIGRDGHWIRAALDREGLDDTDVEAALREHGLDDVGDVRLAVLEEAMERGRRRPLKEAVMWRRAPGRRTGDASPQRQRHDSVIWHHERSPKLNASCTPSGDTPSLSPKIASSGPLAWRPKPTDHRSGVAKIGAAFPSG